MSSHPSDVQKCNGRVGSALDIRSISGLAACIDSLGQLTLSGEVNTPCGVAQVEFIDPREPVKVVPILRAGLVLVEQAASVLLANQTFHLDKSHMLCNGSRLPEKFDEVLRILVADPMLATGDLSVASVLAIEMVT